LGFEDVGLFSIEPASPAAAGAALGAFSIPGLLGGDRNVLLRHDDFLRFWAL